MTDKQLIAKLQGELLEADEALRRCDDELRQLELDYSIQRQQLRRLGAE